MDKKEAILNTLNTTISERGLKIYSLAKITGINRSTLQKSLQGTRTLNLRQFKILINALPFSIQERKNLYDDFLECIWEKERIISNKAILDIINVLTNLTVENTGNSGGGGVERLKLSIYNITFPELKKVYTGEIIFDVIKNLIIEEIELTKDISSDIRIYLPFDNDFFNKTILPCVNNLKNSLQLSILFEFFKSTQANNPQNILILRNILPLLLDPNNHYNIYYLYSDFTNSNNLTLYPYYIILSNKIIMISYDLNSISIIENEEFLTKYIDHHNNKVKFGNPLKVDILEIENTIKHLLTDTIYDDNMYAIAYDPCISAFVPPDMFNDLITDEFPEREEFLNIINHRLSQMSKIPKKYALFNKDSIDDFINDGYIVAFRHPNLRPCTLEQRKIILSNILNLLDSNKIFLRAFSAEEINISRKYEITNIQNHYDFSIMIYSETSIRVITIHETIISNCFIQFINDIMETDKVYTLEETRTLFKQAINKLDNLLKK